MVDPDALEEEFSDDFEDEFDFMAGVEGSAGKKLFQHIKGGPREDPAKRDLLNGPLRLAGQQDETRTPEGRRPYLRRLLGEVHEV